MKKKTVLSAVDILGADDRKLMEVSVEEWGGSVFLKVMSGTDRNEIERVWNENENQPSLDMALQLLVITLVDADGNRLFTEEQTKGLIDKSSAVLQRLMMLSLRHNGMDQKSLDDALKN